MPSIRIEALEGRTKEQKRILVKEMTELMVRVFKAAPDSVRIVFEDIAPHNYARGGKIWEEDA